MRCPACGNQAAGLIKRSSAELVATCMLNMIAVGTSDQAKLIRHPANRRRRQPPAPAACTALPPAAAPHAGHQPKQPAHHISSRKLAHLPRLNGKTNPSTSAPATSTKTAESEEKCRQQATSTASAPNRKASGPPPGTLRVEGGRGRHPVGVARERGSRQARARPRFGADVAVQGCSLQSMRRFGHTQTHVYQPTCSSCR